MRSKYMYLSEKKLPPVIPPMPLEALYSIEAYSIVPPMAVAEVQGGDFVFLLILNSIVQPWLSEHFRNNNPRLDSFDLYFRSLSLLLKFESTSCVILPVTPWYHSTCGVLALVYTVSVNSRTWRIVYLIPSGNRLELLLRKQTNEGLCWPDILELNLDTFLIFLEFQQEKRRCQIPGGTTWHWSGWNNWILTQCHSSRNQHYHRRNPEQIWLGRIYNNVGDFISYSSHSLSTLYSSSM